LQVSQAPSAELKEKWLGSGILVGQVAVGAVQRRGIAPGCRHFTGVIERVRQQPAAPCAQRRLHGLVQPRRIGAAHAQAILDDGEETLAHCAALEQAHIALRLEHPAQLLLGQALRPLHLEAQQHARIARGGMRAQRLDDGRGRVAAHGLAATPAVQRGGARVEQLQVVVDLGHRADRGARGAHRVGLVDGDGRRNALDAINLRAIHAVEELPRVGREGLDVAPLSFGIQRVEGQR
jgi:hypothetical protein